jgi:hypothetical protein
MAAGWGRGRGVTAAMAAAALPVAAAEAMQPAGAPEVGPARYCSAHHRMPINTRNEASKCVPMM